jgi:F-type H+-transporting ATPase subunit delta
MAIPLIETPPDAVDKVYAQSLFALAQEQGGRGALEDLAGETEGLADLIRAHRELAEFLNSRIIPASDKDRVLRAVFTGRISDLLLRFLLVLNRKERLNRTLAMLTAYDQMMQEHFGKVEVDLFTRFPLDGEQVERIRARLHEALGREPIVHAYTDDGMIGGIRMQVGDKLIDASIATQLRRMRERLLEHGAAEVRSRAGRIIEEK